MDDDDDDDDKTVFQTEEERKKIEQDLAEPMDDDTTEIEITQQMTTPKVPYWQQIFG